MNSKKVKAEILAAKESLLALPFEEFCRQLDEHCDGHIARMMRDTRALRWR